LQVVEAVAELLLVVAVRVAIVLRQGFLCLLK
jgi:hypothetical protein